MDKKRSVSTKLWNDPFIEDLNPTEKLLFIYLLTNPLTNILGVYEISIKRISYDTGITKETINKALKVFQANQKVYYEFGFIILVNFLKNQKLNPNMKLGVINSFDELPKQLQDKILNNTSKGFESVSNGLLKYEREIESEKEIEDEIKGIDFELFWNEYHDITKKLKEDKKDTEKFWVKLKIEEKQKAFTNIKLYYDSLNEKKYCKKCRTYLSAKSFNDQFKQPIKKEIPKEQSQRPKILDNAPLADPEIPNWRDRVGGKK